MRANNITQYGVINTTFTPDIIFSGSRYNSPLELRTRRGFAGTFAGGGVVWGSTMISSGRIGSRDDVRGVRGRTAGAGGETGAPAGVAASGQQLLQDPEIDSASETLTAFHRCGSARGSGADRRAKYLIFRKSQGSKSHAELHRLAPNPRADPHMSNRDQTSRDGPGSESTHCLPTELQGSGPHGRPGISQKAYGR